MEAKDAWQLLAGAAFGFMASLLAAQARIGTHKNGELPLT